MEGETVVVSGENNKLDTEEDVADIVAQIEACANLEILKLSGNSYGKEAAKAIGRAVGKHKLLKRALWSDMFVSRLKDEIPVALNHLGDGLITAEAHLVELDVSDNAFGPTGVKGLTVLLNSSVCYSLKTLKINNTGLGIGGGKILSRALLDCHQEAMDNGGKFCLEVFQAGRNRLENEGAIALAEVFEVLGSLVEVSMPQNGIYHEGVSALARALGGNKNLEVLNLSDNTVTEEGSQALVTVLPDLQELRVLNLGDCLVRSDGARMIAEVLKDGHNKLEEFVLCFDELDTDSAMEVAIAMENKRELRRLDLNGNCFGKEGIELIMETIQAKGHSENILGSFSDDEGDSDDDSNHDDDHDDDDNEEDDIMPPLITNDKQSNEKDDEEGDSKRAHLTKLIDDLGDDPSTETVTRTFIEGCKGYSSSDDPTLIHSFIRDCCHSVCEAGQTNVFINEVLVHTGLIKSEDKSFRPMADSIQGPLMGLVLLSKQDYFPLEYKDMLILFFERPNKAIDSIRHILFSELYSS